MGIFQGVPDICLPGSACKRKRKTKRYKQKLAANPPQRHIAKPTVRNGACAGDGWDADGAG